MVLQYELDLPIEVKAGTIGRVALNIPWSGLYTESVVVTIEVGPGSRLRYAVLSRYQLGGGRAAAPATIVPADGRIGHPPTRLRGSRWKRAVRPTPPLRLWSGSAAWPWRPLRNIAQQQHGVIPCKKHAAREAYLPTADP